MDTTGIPNTSDDTQMFGCTEQDMYSLIENNSYARLLDKERGDLLLAMSIISDAQEVLYRGDTECARQYMNRSKFILSECIDSIEPRR